METAGKCERMFYYSRILKLRPRELPVFIRRGSFGHEMMEYGFQALLEGGTVEDAATAAGIPLTRLMESDDPDKAEMMKVYRHVISFITFTQSPDVNWKVVALEDRGMWNLSHGFATDKTTIEANPAEQEDLVFGYTPDLIIEFTSGLYKGQHAVMDYKFLGQYMSEVAINMAQQIPKYMIYRNKTKTDFKIRRGAFIQLNTRADANATGHKLFLIKWVTPNKQRLERIEYENERWAERVEKLYNADPNDLLRTVNKDVCDRCFFGKDLCPADFDGKPTAKIIEREYVINDYGY